jgi:hypothetical protein
LKRKNSRKVVVVYYNKIDMDIKYKHTDKFYLSEDEIKKIDPKKYKEEMKYRELRSFELPLKDIDGNKLSIVQTP